MLPENIARNESFLKIRRKLNMTDPFYKLIVYFLLQQNLSAGIRSRAKVPSM